MNVSCAISFNHESPRRPVNFVSRKITQAAANRQPVTLGNLDAARDWGFAGDYMEAYILMAASAADDYVIGTGEAHTVAELAAMAYQAAGIDNWGEYVHLDDSLQRPKELAYLRANPSKIHALGWHHKMSFQELVRTMVEADMKVAV